MALVKGNARSSSALDATILTGNLPAISGASLTGIASDFVLIKTVTLGSSVAYVDFINGTSGVVFDGTYKKYKLFVTNLNLSNSGNVFGVRFFVSGSINSESVWNVVGTGRESDNSEHSTSNSSGMDYGRLATRGTAYSSTQNQIVEMTFDDPTISRYKAVICHEGGWNGNDYAGAFISCAVWKKSDTVNGIRVMPSAVNFDTGVFSLYGIKS